MNTRKPQQGKSSSSPGRNRGQPKFFFDFFTAAFVLLVSLLTGDAFAQDSEAGTDSDYEQVMEEVIVTGTRITKINAESIVPLTTIDREFIENSGFATVTDVLRTTPYNSFGSYRSQSGFNYGQSGAAFVDLRGLGPENTLVLLNGRRLAPFPGTGAEAQDINQIPMDAVERIEILRDGASAIYGSDAISGVVNIITRKEARHLVATVQLEDPDAPGGESGRLSFMGGFGWERGNLTVSFEHFRQRKIYQTDISRLADPTAFGELNWYAFPASFMFRGGLFAWDTAVDPNCPGNQGDSDVFPDAYRANWEDEMPGTDWLFSAVCGYNYAADILYQPEVKRNSLFLDGRLDLNDHTRLVGRALFNYSDTDTRFAAAPVSPFPWFGADNPNNPVWLFVGQTITDPGLDWWSDGEFDTWTFTEEDVVDVQALMRTVPNGPRDMNSDSKNLSLFAGLEGEAGWLGGVQWDLGAEYARSRIDDTSYNLVNKPILQDIIDDGSLDLFNVQGLDQDDWLSNVTAAMQQANHTGYYFGESNMWTVDGQLSFDGFRWNNRSLPVVTGFEYSNLDYSQGGDPESQQGIIGGGEASFPVESKRRYITTVYAETLLPLASQLDLNLALRFDHYSDFGNTTNPRISLAWRPHTGWLLRASWGTGFKAPTMIELYQPRSNSFGYAFDHIGCENGVTPCALLPYPVIYGGNPDLEPHESESWTAAAVWNITKKLVVELTYYNIEYTNSVGRIGLQDMFDREWNGLTNTVVRNPDGTVEYVEVTRINLSGERTDGIDFRANYALNTKRAGMFDFTLDWTRPLSFEREIQEGDGFEKLLDWIGYPKDRANLTVNWTWDAFQATWVTHYLGEHGKGEDWCWPSDTEGPCEEGNKLLFIDAFWVHDLQLAWNAPWSGQLAIGARNLFNNEPPYHECCYLPPAPYEAQWNLYDAAGRVLYLRYRHEF